MPRPFGLALDLHGRRKAVGDQPAAALDLFRYRASAQLASARRQGRIMFDGFSARPKATALVSAAHGRVARS